jgi:hypothetical protein
MGVCEFRDIPHGVQQVKCIFQGWGACGTRSVIGIFSEHSAIWERGDQLCVLLRIATHTDLDPAGPFNKVCHKIEECDLQQGAISR